MPRAFSQDEKQVIRRKLLEHGHRLFSAHGLRKTNIEEVTNASGISKGAFYLFYESKEALFMDVIELVEGQLRKDLLAAVEVPGPSPRARLLAVLRKAFGILRSEPILRYLTGADFDLLMRRVPNQILDEHLSRDREFLKELVARCQKAGIPIRVQPEEIFGLLYPLVLVALHGDSLGANDLGSSADLLLELVAAFCLGEVEVHLPASQGSRGEGDRKGS
jgi:AcrR family transcriptional regulator